MDSWSCSSSDASMQLLSLISKRWCMHICKLGHLTGLENAVECHSWLNSHSRNYSSCSSGNASMQLLSWTSKKWCMHTRKLGHLTELENAVERHSWLNGHSHILHLVPQAMRACNFWAGYQRNGACIYTSSDTSSTGSGKCCQMSQQD